MAPEHASSQWALLLADTDATQAYVFESNKLPEIRGASRLLDALNNEIGVLVRANVANHGGDLIYAGGGGLLAIVRADQADTLCAQIEHAYPAATTVATISALARPLPDAAPSAFGRTVSWGGRWLRRHKESKAATPFVPCLPHQARCDSCHLRPVDAACSAAHPVADYRICAVCYRKHQEGSGSSRRYWFDAFLGHVASDADSAWHKAPDLTYPYSIGEIGQAHRNSQGLVGFVYLDGDRIGRLLQRLDTPDQYRTVSEALKRATQSAVFDTLGKMLRPASIAEPSDLRPHAPDTVTIFPFEIVTIGGDDVILIVPAAVALPLAATIAEKAAAAFRSALQADTELDEAITLSAGVLLADDHTPLATMADVARQLLKRAKRLGGAVDFHVLHSADMLDRSIDVMRDAYPYTLSQLGDRGRDAYLLGRPYRHADMLALWHGIEQMKRTGFATSQLTQLAEALLRGRRESTLFFEYQRRRASGKTADGYAALTDALGGGNAADPLPWRSVTGAPYSHRTALWDVAELYKFVPAPRAEDTHAS